MRRVRLSTPVAPRRYPVMKPAVRHPPRRQPDDNDGGKYHTHGTGATHEQFHEGHRRTD
ncbi:hypothetical protein CBM2587_B90400 [Cupriavidus taiwanensis]|uniref:Uncharacterized protein n=1 Tax=Cupriavidus taiwanensis TaxID=164546 RepID=A0A375CDI0_9BURK|nr:hypothetical protein CBM2587_B90400 [Cupriavidus taiwanensis]